MNSESRAACEDAKAISLVAQQHHNMQLYHIILDALDPLPTHV